MAKQHPHSLEQISIADWEATPASVKELVSSLLVQELDNISSNEAIDRGNDRLTRFLDAASVGIAVHNAKGDLVYVNQSGKELLTQSPSPKAEKVEELPQAFQIYRSTTQQPYPLEELPSCLALAGEKVHVEDMEVHRPDRIVPLEVMANPIFNPLGEVEYVIATFQDVTARRNSEQALVDSKTRYQQVVEAQTDFVLRSFPDTTITFANPSLCRALGLSLQEVIGMKWIDFADPEDLEPTLQKIAGLNPDNPTFLAENRDLRAGGVIGWTQWLDQGIFNLQGELVGIQSVGRDITTLKQAELEISQQKKLLQLIFDHLPLMVGLYSPTGKVLMINRYLEQLIGWTQAEYATVDVLRECYPDRADYEAVMQHIITADSSWNESRLRTRDGRTLDTTWTQIRLADGRSISFGLDITEQKRLVASLAEINQELEIRVAQRTEALQQQEELLREAQQVAHLGSWELFVATGEVVWSPELFQIFGYDPGQPIPSFEQQSRIFVLEDYQRLTYLVDRAIQYGEPYEADLQIIRKDGSLGYVFAKGQPHLDEEGRVSRLVGIAMDIGDRKRAEQEIIRSRDLREAIFNESTDALFLVNTETGVILDCNQRAVELFEVADKTGLLGTVGHNFQREHFTDHELESIRQDILTNGIWTQELEYVSQEGNYFWGNIAVKEVMVAGEIITLTRITDISDRKRAEQEIIQNRDLREAIFNELADALFLVDSETLLTVDCNQKAVELFEVKDKADLIGIAGHTLQRYQFTIEELAEINRDMETNGFWSREIEYVTQRGNCFWGSIVAKPIAVAGKTMNLVRVTDVSDRKLSEAKIQQTTKQLETANRELEAFAYSVSHDLRAPLRAIDGFSKALLEDYGDRFDEEAQDYFDRIHRAVERMGELIDDLLRLSRVSRAEIQYGKVNLTKLVQDIATNLQESHPERRVEFAIVPEAIVYADNNLMRVVLENLLQNAWKFTSHHPTARIEFGILKDGEATQGATLGEIPRKIPPEIIYFIRDDGAGFDMAYATMLFGVFQRLHNTHEFPGTGIGLATVQRVIHRHGGQIWAEGAVEAGATIYFTLPNQNPT